VSTFVLVHGSWHGAWCWYKVIARLRASGHRVIAPDLPALGADKTAIADVTLQGWTDALLSAIDAADEPVILVGHSRGGILISEAAQARPNRVRTLVYLCAFLLRDGEVLLAVSGSDTGSALAGHMTISPDQRSVTVSDAVIDLAFYAGCDADDRALARTLLQPEPLAPSATPIHVTPERFGRVPRVYIECLQDRAISPSMQRRMIDASPCQRVISMNTDHSPFFSAPDELVRHLLTVS
jgi:pimeloyl-ACP methyl ester carboxylesterase